MEGTMVLAIAIAVPVILLPAAFIWYLNIGGLAKAYRQMRTEQKTTK